MSGIYLHISAGSGPQECEWVVGELTAAYAKEAKAEGLSAVVIYDEVTRGSGLVRVNGAGAERFAKDRIGTVRWIGQSPYRKNHRRKNWFVSVSLAPRLADIPELSEADITYQAMKASGPGGQHVNATESAVRATHVPTGISVAAREERSQHANKRLCRAKLAAHFAGRAAQAKSDAKSAKWQAHNALERGNEVRVYRGSRFKLEA